MGEGEPSTVGRLSSRPLAGTSLDWILNGQVTLSDPMLDSFSLKVSFAAMSYFQL